MEECIYMFTHKYTSLSKAAEAAATHCDRWRFATADEFYDSDSLQGIAELHDEEVYVEEESFYVVSPGGAIGFSEDGKAIEWLFIPVNSVEELPLSLEPETANNLCPKCGGHTAPGDRFCGACGAKL